MKVVVSACLLGENCKYSGGNNYQKELADLLAGHQVIPVCPEVTGGLPTPRPPSEIVDGRVINRAGVSVDAEFRRGAEISLAEAGRQHADLAILKANSPSCGSRQIYDGTFSGRLVEGSGIFAGMMMESGYPVLDETQIEEIRAALRRERDPQK